MVLVIASLVRAVWYFEHKSSFVRFNMISIVFKLRVYLLCHLCRQAVVDSDLEYCYHVPNFDEHKHNRFEMSHHVEASMRILGMNPTTTVLHAYVELWHKFNLSYETKSVPHKYKGSS